VVDPGEAILNVLQEPGVLPVDMVYGFTLAVEGVDSDGKSFLIAICMPGQALTTTAGQAAWLVQRTERLMDEAALD